MIQVVTVKTCWAPRRCSYCRALRVWPSRYCSWCGCPRSKPRELAPIPLTEEQVEMRRIGKGLVAAANRVLEDCFMRAIREEKTE
jgi:hypothetical protein